MEAEGHQDQAVQQQTHDHRVTQQPDCSQVHGGQRACSREDRRSSGWKSTSTSPCADEPTAGKATDGQKRRRERGLRFEQQKMEKYKMQVISIILQTELSSIGGTAFYLIAVWRQQESCMLKKQDQTQALTLHNKQAQKSG